MDSLQKNVSALREVPNVDFATFSYSAHLYNEYLNDDQVWDYRGNSQPIQNLAFAVAATGKDLTPTFFPPAPVNSANATWSFNFTMPALNCRPVTGAKAGDIWRSVWNSFNWTTAGAPVYLSWVPWRQDSLTQLGISLDPQDANFHDRDLPYYVNSTGMWGPPEALVSTDGPISFYVAVIPNAQNLSIVRQDNGSVTVTPTQQFANDNFPVVLPAPCYFKPMANFSETVSMCDYTAASIFDQSTLVRCDLLEVSTPVKFDYKNSTVPVSLAKGTWAYTITPLNGSQYFVGLDEGLIRDPTRLAEEKCVPFIADPYPVLNSQQEGGKEPLRNSCEFDVRSLRLLSYQSTLEAFFRTFSGNITNRSAAQSRVTDTVLLETDELDWLRDFISNGVKSSLDVASIPLLYSRISAARKYVATMPGPTNANQGQLPTAIQAAFARLTLSLLSEPYF